MALFRQCWFFVLVISSMVVTSLQAEAKDEIGETLDAFIQRMTDTHQLDKEQLKSIFAKAVRQQKIIDSMNKPAESLPWYKYRKIFVKESRIKAGVEFWNKHRVDLERAEETFKVPASMIVGIIGVETFYGKIQGNIPVLDALYTLGFHYPKRAAFFRKELEQFLLLCREQNWNVWEPKGSYAGAMGMGQFIPTSYREYAVDFDGDGKIDLFNNTSDAIGSVANYFKRHHWRWGESVAYQVKTAGKNPELFESDGLKPNSTVGAIQEKGFDWSETSLPEEVASLYPFQQEAGSDYWVGFSNFYVITRYNRSPLYALAVYQFSQEVIARREQSSGKSNS